MRASPGLEEWTQAARVIDVAVCVDGGMERWHAPPTRGFVRGPGVVKVPGSTRSSPVSVRNACVLTNVQYTSTPGTTS